jgi:methionyl-tRNA formyltransferase
MNIVLACATARGCRCLEKLAGLVDGRELTVCSFREEAHEPAFLDQIATTARATGARFFETKQLDAGEAGEFLARNPIDLLLAVSWRYMIPRSVYGRAARGSYVFHDSLLPKYRGFAPTVWAMINGESQTGVTLLEMADGVDEGDIVAQQPVEIGQADTIANVMQRVTGMYLELLEGNLAALLNGSVPKKPQDHAAATYGCKRVPGDNLIDWSRNEHEVLNLIRATTRPYPGAFTWLAGKRLTVWSASRAVDTGNYVGRVPGRVVQLSKPNGPVVLCGQGAVRLQTVQWDGAECQPAGAVIDKLGMTLGRI